MSKVDSKSNNLLSLECTSVIKVMALLLMFCHHFFNTSWILDDNMFVSIFHIGSVTFEGVIADSGGCCVAIFAFLSGYGLYFSFKKNNRWKKTINRCAILYIDFLLVIVCMFVPLFIMFGNSLTIKGWILNLIGLDSSLNQFDWYVPFYVVAVFVMTIYSKYLDKGKFADIISCIVIITLPIISMICPIKFIKSCLIYIPSMLFAYLIAKYKIFDYVYKSLNRFLKHMWQKRCIGIIIMLFVILFRYFVCTITSWKIYNQFDWLFAFVFIFGAICTFQSINIPYILTFGKMTTNMWYLHAIFFGAYIRLQYIAYWPKISVFIVLWSFVLLLPFAWIFMKLQTWVKKQIFK